MLLLEANALHCDQRYTEDTYRLSCSPPPTSVIHRASLTVAFRGSRNGSRNSSHYTVGMSVTYTNQYRDNPINSNQHMTSTSVSPASTANQQQRNRNTSKRTKERNDSFESEHRGANIPNGYFNLVRPDQSNSWSRPPRSQEPKHESNRPSFPPFRLVFVNDEKPSELSIIKDMNEHSHLCHSHGCYSSFEKQSLNFSRETAPNSSSV